MSRERELEESVRNGTADQRDKEVLQEIKEGMRDNDGKPLVAFL